MIVKCMCCWIACHLLIDKPFHRPTCEACCLMSEFWAQHHAQLDDACMGMGY